jgi:hypothetical protein
MPPVQTLSIPELSLPPVQEEAGQVHLVLWNAEDLAVAGVEEEVLRSGRKTERYRLVGGEALLVTEQTSCVCPAEVAGVLRRVSPAGLAWLEHRDLTAMQERIGRGEWAAMRRETVTRWQAGFRYQSEVTDAGGERPGLRPPQIGALHAIALDAFNARRVLLTPAHLLRAVNSYDPFRFDKQIPL